MADLTRLEQGLLDLGLEDLIALPEITGTEEVAEPSGETPTVDQLSSALISLLRCNLIGVWVGPPGDERRVAPEDAEGILTDRRRYLYSSEQDGTERAYFVNRENLT